MYFTIYIPDELFPGAIAMAVLESDRLGTTVTPQMVIQEAAIQAATKVCQDLKVGPYYIGLVPPQFNPDGTPYSGNSTE